MYIRCKLRAIFEEIRRFYGSHFNFRVRGSAMDFFRVNLFNVLKSGQYFSDANSFCAFTEITTE